MKIRLDELIIVVCVSFVIACTNSISFFYHLTYQPAGTMYLGTIHYWEDYFFYLNHFFQGSHGAWLTVNRYTSESTPASIIYWCNVLLGKIGGIFFLPPVISYNISVLLLSITAIILSYLVIRKTIHHTPLTIYAFLFATLATSLINRVKSEDGTMILWPFQIWRTPHFAFDRLGGAPHQLIQTILAYLFIVSVFSVQSLKDRKMLLWAILSGLLLTTINPIQALFYVGILWLTELVWFIKKHPASKSIWLIPITIGVGAMSVYINKVLSILPHIQSMLWEASQHSYTTPGFLVLSLGPVFLLAVIGLISRWKKLSKIEIFGALTITIGYLIFFSHIPQSLGFSNLRILFPASYIFWGIFAAYGTSYIAKKLTLLHSRNQGNSDSGNVHKFIQLSIVCVFIIISLPTLRWEILQKIPKTDDTKDPIIYLPAQVFEGYEFLANTLPYDDVAIASPDQHFDTMIPALSGHTTYSGHQLTTIDNGKKQEELTKFYTFGISKEVAQEWLGSKNIKYVLLTNSDAARSQFESYYPFLQKQFSNEGISMYSF